MQAAGVGVACAAYPLYVEPRWLAVRQQAIRLRRVNLARPVRVLLISDLHRSRVVSFGMIAAAIDAGLALKPDLICVTGDFITFGDEVDMSNYPAVLKKLPAVAPTYAVLGNHDGGAWTAARNGAESHRVVDGILEDAGIELLHNRNKSVQVRESKVRLVGVADLWSREVDTDRAFAGVGTEEPVVLLAHNPDTKELVAGERWDLMLSGHTHGGQVRLPWMETRYAPVADRRYVAGLGEWSSRWIYVTCGVGNFGGVRLNCRPEVNLLEVS